MVGRTTMPRKNTRPARKGEAGRCSRCRGPSKKGSVCRACGLSSKADRKTRRADRLSAAGKCSRCARDVHAANTGAYDLNTSLRFLVCPDCFFKAVAENNLRRRKRWEELRDIFESQGRRCAYTGVFLVLGLTATLDHKVPRSRGGTDEALNLQWVDRDVNLAKHDLTHEEFLSLCRRILGMGA